MTRAAILSRVSTSDQADADRHSLPVQAEQMERLAERNGWEVVARFEIPGESAYTHLFAKRPQFLAALEAAERGEFEVLIVYDFSRFARNQLMAHASLQRLRDAGVRLFGSNGVDYTADDDMAGMEAIFAARASRDHSRRVSHAIERRHLMGLPTGDIPFGYERVLRTEPGGAVVTDTTVPPVVVPAEAEAIRWAYREFLVGSGYLALASEFNRRGLRPHSKQRRVGLTGYTRPANSEFTMTGLQRILDNPFYIGFVTHRGEQSQGRHEPIVDPELFAAVQAKKNRHQRMPRGEALLTGLCLCAVCNSSIWCEKSGSAYRYYGERPRGRRAECANARTRWRADAVEELVGAALCQLQLDGDFLAYVESQSRRRRRVEPKTRVQLEERQRRASVVYMARGMSDEAYQAEMREVNRQLAALPPDIDALLFAGRRVSSALDIWEMATEADRREVVRKLLRSVRIDTAGKSLQVEPWPEYEPLFSTRRDFVDLVRPGGVGLRSSTSGLYLPAELGVAS